MDMEIRKLVIVLGLLIILIFVMVGSVKAQTTTTLAGTSTIATAPTFVSDGAASGTLVRAEPLTAVEKKALAEAAAKLKAAQDEYAFTLARVAAQHDMRNSSGPGWSEWWAMDGDFVLLRRHTFRYIGW